MDFTGWTRSDLAEFSVYMAALSKAAAAVAANSKSTRIIEHMKELEQDFSLAGKQGILEIQERRNKRNPLVATVDGAWAHGEGQAL